MNPNIPRFKECIHVALDAHRVTPDLFWREASLVAFLLNPALEKLTPREIAVQAVSYLCAGDGSDLDAVTISAVVDFLNQTVGCIVEGDTMRRRNLKELTEESGSRDHVRQWVRRWYGAEDVN